MDHEDADLGLGVLEPDLLGDGSELIQVAVDEHEAEPEGGEAEIDCFADAVGGGSGDGPELGAAVQGLAGAEKIGAEPRGAELMEAQAVMRRPTAGRSSAHAGSARRISGCGHVRALPQPPVAWRGEV